MSPSTIYYAWGALGFFLGGVFSLTLLERFTEGNTKRIVLALVVGVYAGLFGARLLYVLESDWQLIFHSPSQALAFWNGGLAWQGGFLAGFPALLVAFRLQGLRSFEHAGACVPGMALAHAFGRMGCLQLGCCHGRPSGVPWAIYSEHMGAFVHPTQIYSMIWEFLFAFVAYRIWRIPRYRMFLVPFYGASLGLQSLVVEAFKGTPDGPGLLPGLRFYQSVGLAVILLSIATGSLLLRAGIHKSETEKKNTRARNS